MSMPIPKEIVIGGVYLQPTLVLLVVSLFLTWMIAKLLNRTRITRFFANPPVVFLAIWALTSALIGLFVLSP